MYRLGAITETWYFSSNICAWQLLNGVYGESRTQSCLTLCDPMHYTVHGILQARILEWVALPFSRGYSQPRDQTQVSHTAEGFFTS